MYAKWQFLATLHGKGACNGAGEQLRLAKNRGTQNPYKDHIMTRRHLYEWAVVKFFSVTFEYDIVEDHGKEIMMFKERFRKA
jgi:hypothetical protein